MPFNESREACKVTGMKLRRKSFPEARIAKSDAVVGARNRDYLWNLSRKMNLPYH
jgi:hypothetical protein